MRIHHKTVFVVVVGVLLALGSAAPVWAQATNVVCTGCVASVDLADLGVTSADLATSAVSSVKIADGAIVNADISAAAAIAGTKVAPNFGSQNVVTTGNVGIGTTSPAAKFHISKSGGSGMLRLEDTSAIAGQNIFELRLRQIGPNDFSIFDASNNATRLYINGSGNVGIGTTSPRAKLELMGDGASLASAKIILSETQSGLGALFLNSVRAGSGNRLDIGEGNDTFLTIRSDDDSGGTTSRGNVGIGTTSPAAKLQIGNGSGTQGILIQTGGTSGNYVEFDVPGRDWQVGSNLAVGGDNFEVFDQTAGLNRFLINSSGNVGIGTTSPAAKLDIEGNLQMYTGGPWFYMLSQNSKNISLATVGGGIAIDQAGNVGIGTTSPGMPLVIKGDGSANAVGFNDGSNVQRGSIFVSSASLGLNASTKLYLTSNGSGITIDPDGNVGIGTADPGVYKLAVKGKIHAEEVVVDTGWADFVFKKGYDLMPLEKVARHIEQAGHLPGIPSEKEVRENGVSVGQMQSKLLQKIEEMTLYVIDLKKENDQLKERISLIENQAR